MWKRRYEVRPEEVPDWSKIPVTPVMLYEYAIPTSIEDVKKCKGYEKKQTSCHLQVNLFSVQAIDDIYMIFSSSLAASQFWLLLVPRFPFPPTFP